MRYVSRLAVLFGSLGLLLSIGDMSADAKSGEAGPAPFAYVDLHVDLPYQHVF